jgi:hypothetical protein
MEKFTLTLAVFHFSTLGNVIEGKEYSLSEEAIVLPKSIELKDGVPVAVEMQTLLKFTGALFFKEFDDPRPKFEKQTCLSRTRRQRSIW